MVDEKNDLEDMEKRSSDWENAKNMEIWEDHMTMSMFSGN
jgi:hypothetical protein